MAQLSFRHMDKIYPNNVQAVFDFNLEINDKEFIVFVGPSGCGKSTTLRMVAGLETISRGELYIDNKKVNDIDPMDRDIAMVFQNYALYPHMTVYNNMAFALKMRKVYMPVFSFNKKDPTYLKKCDEIIKAHLQEQEKEMKGLKKEELSGFKLRKKAELRSKLLELKREFSKPVYGIDKNQIKINQKEYKDVNKNLSYVATEIEKLKAELKIVEAQPNNDEKLKKIKNLNCDITNLENEFKSLNTKKTELANKIKEVSTTKAQLTELRHFRKDEIDEKVLNAARILDLVPYLNRKPKALSGGQRQRVALGRAIVRKPKVFLMDEPLSNLDAKLRVQTRTEITNLHEKIGATTIYVTHDQTEAMTMADRIVIMKLGFVQQIGTPKEVYENPINIFVAGFIGSPAMNFFKGNFDGKGFIFDGPHKFSFPLASEQVELLKNFKGRPVVMGIRPEDIYLDQDKAAENKSKPLSLVCDASELLGHEIAIYSNIDGQKIVTKTPAKFAVKSGDRNTYVLNQKHIHFFDLETGKCIDYVNEKGEKPFTKTENLVKDPSDLLKQNTQNKEEAQKKASPKKKVEEKKEEVKTVETKTAPTKVEPQPKVEKVEEKKVEPQPKVEKVEEKKVEPQPKADEKKVDTKPQNKKTVKKVEPKAKSKPIAKSSTAKPTATKPVSKASSPKTPVSKPAPKKPASKAKTKK